MIENCWSPSSVEIKSSQVVFLLMPLVRSLILILREVGNESTSFSTFCAAFENPIFKHHPSFLVPSRTGQPQPGLRAPRITRPFLRIRHYI
jgi:hypothetical protein